MPRKFSGPLHRAVVDALESRRLLSTTTPASVLTLADRQALLKDWIGSDKSTLTADLAAKNTAKFDSDLLSYVENTSSALGKFFFDSSSLSTDLSFIHTNGLGYSDITTIANDIVNHVFPDGNEDYDVQLPAGNVTWLKTTATSGTEDLHELNRQDWFMDLSLAYRLTGNAAYATELTDEMATWSAANPPLANPNSWATNSTVSWYLLDTSQRAETWLYTYFEMLGTSGWSAQANTLFLYEMDLHGQFLDAATPPVLGDNRTVQQARSLLSIGQLFPDLAGASKWVTDGHNLLFKSMDAQIYPDGSDREQSPGYADEILTDLMEQQKQDTLNGYTWPSTQLDRLKKGFKAFVAMLDPNGERSAQGDSERVAEGTLLSESTSAGLTHYPQEKPRVFDVLLFGSTAESPLLSDPIDPPPPTRGLTDELPDSGNYIFRSDGSDPNAEQVTFNAGPKGGGHGHDDVLNFELFAFGQPLIADTGPWAYNTSAQRDWATSTPSSNTISIDNTSAGPLDGLGNPDIVLDQYTVTDSYAQVTAHYFGYGALAGQPVLARSIWYNYAGVMLIVDWAWSASSHAYTVSFNIAANATANEDGSIQTNNSGGNVKIDPILTSGQTTAAQHSVTFDGATFTPFANFSDSATHSNATRYVVNQTATNAVFGTLITDYDGSTPSNVSATWMGTPVPGHAVSINLDINGVEQTVNFSPPTLKFPGSSGTVTSQYTSIAYDAEGDLDMAFYNPTDKLLEFTQRGPSGIFSAVSIIDGASGSGITPSVAVNANGTIGVAYISAGGALMYASFVGGTWSTQTVTSDASSTPDLAFSRNNGASISFYDSKTKSLELAATGATGFTFTKIDSGTNVGVNSKLHLDPDRPTASKWGIVYEDGTHHTVKYAVQEGSGWDIETVASATGTGELGITFNSSSIPVVSYYNAATNDDYVAVDSGTFGNGGSWSVTEISQAGLGGASDNLFYDKSGRLDIVYTDNKHHHVIEAVLSKGVITRTTLASAGATEVNAAIYSTKFSYTNQNGTTTTVGSATA